MNVRSALTIVGAAIICLGISGLGGGDWWRGMGGGLGLAVVLYNLTSGGQS